MLWGLLSDLPGHSTSAPWPHVPPFGYLGAQFEPRTPAGRAFERSSVLERLQAGRLCARAQFNIRTPVPGL
eukprot:13846592-Alexandrium_andersonii.AAC.1